MTDRLRKLLLTVHVACSVGWLGALAAFIALGVVAMTSRDPQSVRAAAIAMNLIVWLVITPLAIASPVTGIVQSLGTSWGLFRHYWILIKILITIPSTAILLVFHLRPIGYLADVAVNATLAQVAKLSTQPTIECTVALIALVVATALSTYKPTGRTPFWRV